MTNENTIFCITHNTFSCFNAIINLSEKKLILKMCKFRSNNDYYGLEIKGLYKKIYWEVVQRQNLQLTYINVIFFRNQFLQILKYFYSMILYKWNLTYFNAIFFRIQLLQTLKFLTIQAKDMKRYNLLCFQKK